MKWKKLGLVFRPPGTQAWARSYAHLPTPVILDEDRVRIYFAALDDSRRGSIGFVDVEASNPLKVQDVHPHPILSPGDQGSFDADGVNPSSIVRGQDDWNFYYIGWQRNRHGVPYALFGGCAVSSNGLKFTRHSPLPFLPPCQAEPYLRSAPFVIQEGNGRRCWYVSATGWEQIQGKPYPRYHVRLAETRDGLEWETSPHLCVELEGDEFGLGRPWVIRDRDRYRMWYSIRSRSRPYRIGYAESFDGFSWRRLDDRAGIEASQDGWDSAMVCYAAVIDVQDRRYMFYNGNQHGESGFGVAVLEQD